MTYPKGIDIRAANKYRPGWNWEKMAGDSIDKHWSLTDLASLDKVMGMTPGRNVVVQAGGNIGLFPKRLAEEFKVVYTFEPSGKLYGELVCNATERNIIAGHCALGDTRDPVSLACVRRDGTDRPAHGGMTHVAGDGDVPMMLIDDLSLDACDLIYLDVEGYEFHAVTGAFQTITEFHPVIAVEVNINIEFYGKTASELDRLITGMGYRHANKFLSDEVYVSC